MKPEAQKSLVITLLIMSIWVVLLFVAKLRTQTGLEEIFYPTELVETPQIEDFFKTLTENNSDNLETHRASNQADKTSTSSVSNQKSFRQNNELEKFISELEQERENTDWLAMYASENTRLHKKFEKNKPDNKSEKTEITSQESENINPRKSTNYYHLEGRNAVYFPNPVYTCPAGGKVVINITVNSSGVVTRTDYNASASETTNACLIDQALEYAAKAQFSSEKSKEIQVGTITYIFQGQ
ncbi:MAG TPA: hypothetical protein VKZ42_04475 [Flavobacteriaceae bacterium]|nr:hypothetical protein [Flavobacteriaceae bacterium]